MHQETDLRISIIERVELPRIMRDVEDHARRLSVLENKSPDKDKSMRPDVIKEMGVLLAIGAVVGAMLATGDPAGVLLVLKQVVGK